MSWGDLFKFLPTLVSIVAGFFKRDKEEPPPSVEEILARPTPGERAREEARKKAEERLGK